MVVPRPIVRRIIIDGEIDDDCACPDVGCLPPEIYRADRGEPSIQDCACPDAGSSMSPQSSLHAGSWRRSPDLYRAALPHHHEVTFFPSPAAGIAVLNAPARRILDGFAAPHRLSQVAEELPALHPDDVERTASQLARYGLLQPVGGDTQAQCLASPHTLTAWLHVTNRCNLRCTYCYVQKSDAAMDEATGRAAVEAVFRSAVRHGFRAVKLKYAGGEPTLNFPLVRSLHAQAELLAGYHGLELRQVLLSNGVALSDAIIVALRDMNIRLAVSLDGIGATHDGQRGRGTSVQVVRSVDRALDLGLRPHLSITVTAQSIDGLSDVVAYALDRDLTFNLNFYRAHDRIAGETGLGAENACLIEGLRAALGLLGERSPQQGFGGALDRVSFSYPHSYPCGVGQNYVVIDHLGRISRCHMEIGRTVGAIWEDDPLTAIRSAGNGFRNVEVDTKEECSACVCRYWCAGGCPFLTYRLTGRSDARSPYCEVYRSLLPEVLRLEGLRLISRSPPTV